MKNKSILDFNVVLHDVQSKTLKARSSHPVEPTLRDLVWRYYDSIVGSEKTPEEHDAVVKKYANDYLNQIELVEKGRVQAAFESGLLGGDY